MTPEELNAYFDVFLVTLAGPYFIGLLLVLGWAVFGGQSREDRMRRGAIGVAWTTVSVILVNLVFINVFGRMILFGCLTLLGIAVYALWERRPW